jgi:hypothetical protein
MQGKVANGLFAIKTGIFGDLLGWNVSLAEQKTWEIVDFELQSGSAQPAEPLESINSLSLSDPLRQRKLCETPTADLLGCVGTPSYSAVYFYHVPFRWLPRTKDAATAIRTLSGCLLR